MREILITATVIPVFLMSFTALGQSAPASAAAQLAPPIAVVPSRPAKIGTASRNVAHDEEINVWASSDRHVRCLFTGATDDYLFCEPLFRRSQGSGGEYRFSRADVDKIRLEQAQRNLKRAVRRNNRRWGYRRRGDHKQQQWRTLSRRGRGGAWPEPWPAFSSQHPSHIRSRPPRLRAAACAEDSAR